MKRATWNIKSSCKQIWFMCGRAGASFKPFLLLKALPNQVIGKSALLGLGGASEDQILLLQLCCMQCWQHALWGTELHIQPSTLIYHSLSIPLQGGLQFRCQAWHLFGICFAFPFLFSTSVDSVFHLLVTDAFLSGLCCIPAAVTFLFEEFISPCIPTPYKVLYQV